MSTETVRAVDHNIAYGVWPDMTEHGWRSDEWPAILERVMASDILINQRASWDAGCRFDFDKPDYR